MKSVRRSKKFHFSHKLVVDIPPMCRYKLSDARAFFDIIDKEDTYHPLNDEEIASRLGTTPYAIKKMREYFGIPDSNDRRWKL